MRGSIIATKQLIRKRLKEVTSQIKNLDKQINKFDTHCQRRKQLVEKRDALKWKLRSLNARHQNINHVRKMVCSPINN